MARPFFRLELLSTLTFAVALAMIEGGIISVFTKKTFHGVVSEGQLNFFVAFLGATPELANILSFIWSWKGQGKRKIPFINALQVATISLIALLAIVPHSIFGLWLIVFLALTARICWSGIITIRPTVWRANYSRAFRARVVARLSTGQMLVAATLGIALGAMLDRNPDTYHLIVPAAGFIGLIAVWATSRLRVRRESRLLALECSGSRAMTPWGSLAVVVRVLRNDPWYARFMRCMFLLGVGNLMLTPIMVITLAEQFNAGYLKSILISSAIPALTMPLALPIWSRLLDRAHVVRFRALHSWTFVAASIVLTIAVGFNIPWLLFVGAVLQGIGFAGGTLAWNLGHVDFAPPSQTSQYMATHVTLNGVRGLIAPFVAVFLYEAAKKAGLDASLIVLLIASFMSMLGALGFVRLRAAMGPMIDQVSRTT